MIVTRSSHTYAETTASLVSAIESRGLTVFARIDHAAGAREVGMELADEEVLLFGNPRSGTPLMQADPSCGIDLPLRILVWDGGDGVLLGYSDPLELADEYRLQAQRPVLEKMSALLAALVAELAN